MENKHLFILSPPYSGSTALWRLLQTSKSVSALPDEGQKLPELAPMMRADPWNPAAPFDWGKIRRVWESYWDLTRPVLLEKSPPHLCRHAALSTAFPGARYLLLLRDPLATCEALHRRNGMRYDAAARRWVEWLRLHLECRSALPSHFVLHYEAMTDHPGESFAALARWMPELADVQYGEPVAAHSVDGVQQRSLTNLNARKLDRVGPAERAAVRAILREHGDLVERGGYAAALAD